MPLFCAGGIATPADAVARDAARRAGGVRRQRHLQERRPARRVAKAIVEATTHYADAAIVAKVSRGLGDAMRGEEIDTLDVKLAERGW